MTEPRRAALETLFPEAHGIPSAYEGKGLQGVSVCNFIGGTQNGQDRPDTRNIERRTRGTAPCRSRLEA